MAQVHLHIPSFNAGELSPLLGARFAVEKVQAGCRRLRNFIPHVHGPAFRRPGMQYLGASRGNNEASSLRAFNFSVTTGFILEFHPSGLYLWGYNKAGAVQNIPIVAYKKANGTPNLLESWPYKSAADCAELQIAQVNDTCYIAHPKHPPRKLKRIGGWEGDGAKGDQWLLEDVVWKWPALGDENVRTETIASPQGTPIGEVPLYEWEEVTIKAGQAFTFSVTGVLDTPGKAKVVEIQRWDEAQGYWESRKEWKLSWTKLSDVPTARSIAAETKARRWRIKHNEKAAIGGTANIKWTELVPGEDPAHPTEVPHTFSLSLASPERESYAAVEVPAGEWQMAVDCPDPLPAGAKLFVQQKGEKAWLTANGKPKVAYTIALERGQTVRLRGVSLKKATTFRFIYGGVTKKVKVTPTAAASTQPASRGMYLAENLAATARFETVETIPSEDLTLACSSETGAGLTLTASQPIFKAGHEGSFWQLTHRREQSSIEIVATENTLAAPTAPGVTPVVLPKVSAKNLRVTGRWDFFSYGTWDATIYLEKNVGGDQWETVRSWTGHKDRNVIASGEHDGSSVLRLRLGPGSFASSGSGSTETRPRFVLEATDTRVSGIVKITGVGPVVTDGKALTAEVTVITPLESTAPTTEWTEGAWSTERGQPRTVALHGQRLWFGGTAADPLRLWGSVVADYEDFRRTTFDDAGVSFVPAAQQSNQLQWMTSHGQHLVLGTKGDEWTVSGGVDNGPITPSSVQVQRRSGYGSHYVPALLLGESIVFVQRGGQKMRQVAPRSDGFEWSASDLTVLAEHVARQGIKQTAAMHHPFSILWAVTTDGQLLGMTFEQEQNVFAWHVHPTDGKVESVAVLYGEQTDEVWLQVQRGVRSGAKTETIRTIERLDPLAFMRNFSDPKTLLYSDSAVRVSAEVDAATKLPVPFTEISTRPDPLDPKKTVQVLAHLEGRAVAVLADGAVVSPLRNPMTNELEYLTVVGKRPILPEAVTTAVVGLPYLSELQPMRMDLALADGTAQHRRWRTARVGLALHESLGGEVADSPESRFEELNHRETRNEMRAAPPLYSGERELAIESHARAGVDVIVRTTEPVPLNIGSLTLKGDVYGD